MTAETCRRIRWRLEEMATGRPSRDERLVHWRTISRLAMDEYDKELAELDSLNFAVVEDPSLTGVPTV